MVIVGTQELVHHVAFRVFVLRYRLRADDPKYIRNLRTNSVSVFIHRTRGCIFRSKFKIIGGARIDHLHYALSVNICRAVLEENFVMDNEIIVREKHLRVEGTYDPRGDLCGDIAGGCRFFRLLIVIRSDRLHRGGAGVGKSLALLHVRQNIICTELTVSCSARIHRIRAVDQFDVLN